MVGYDENSIFIAESLAELVNCDENTYNRKICNEDFMVLWNTAMLNMPLYAHTFFCVNLKAEKEIKHGMRKNGA